MLLVCYSCVYKAQELCVFMYMWEQLTHCVTCLSVHALEQRKWLPFFVQSDDISLQQPRDLLTSRPWLLFS